MNDGLKEIYLVYDKICKASEQEDSLTVKMLRKECGIQKRDLKVLLEFFYTYYNFFEDYAFDFQIFDSNGQEYNPVEKDEFGNENSGEEFISELQDVHIVVDNLMKKIKDDWTIKVKDTVTSYVEKLKGITKVNVPEADKNIVEKEMNKLGNVKVESLKLISKKRKQLDKLQQNKREIIKAILTSKKVMIARRIHNGKIEKIEKTPIGLYYDIFLQRYYGVFEEEDTSISEVDLGNITFVQVSNPAIIQNCEFDIEDYLAEKQKYKMVIRVYEEGNVRKKIESLLHNNQLEIQIKDNYNLYTFMASDEWLYAEKIRQFGRSVIIEEPKEIRECMIDEIKDTIELYAHL